MKKIIILMIALTVGVSAFAATFNEVAEAFKSIDSTSPTRWDDRREFVRNEKDVISPEFNAWMATEAAKFAPEEIEFKKATEGFSDEQMKSELSNRMLFSYYYAVFGGTLEGVPARVAIILNANRYIEFNPTAYTSLKEESFVVDKVTLPMNIQILLSMRAEDEDAIWSYSLKDFKGVPEDDFRKYIKWISEKLTTTQDLDMAFSKCEEIESYLISNKGSEANLNLIKNIYMMLIRKETRRNVTNKK